MQHRPQSTCELPNSSESAGLRNQIIHLFRTDPLDFEGKDYIVQDGDVMNIRHSG
jgi:ribosome-binding ATPase YchF (GTP1/OBG family)